MARLDFLIGRVAPHDSKVLIEGESGTGKGVVARRIHDLGKRAGKPFVVVNCGAIPESLIDSELFGYERGAFTGAYCRQIGKFEAANTGTIFLDEIGELSLASQTRLLRVLEEKEIERIGGGGRRVRADARVIAATNRDLHKMVSEGTFREDVYYRLNVILLRTPALRERREDIPALAHHFALKAAIQAGRRLAGISPELLDMFQSHPWPGNVRQLENLIQRAVAMGETEYLVPGDIPQDFSCAKTVEMKPKVQRLYDALDETGREVCIAAFTASQGNCAAAAQMMGLHRNSVYRLVRKYGLNHLLREEIPT
jgi:transcriptional regulator with PAS, ATPase and Fis domain